MEKLVMMANKKSGNYEVLWRGMLVTRGIYGGAAAQMNIDGNLIKHFHIFNWMSHRQSTYRTKQISPAILIIDVLFSFRSVSLCLPDAIQTTDVSKDTANIRPSAMQLTF